MEEEDSEPEEPMFVTEQAGGKKKKESARVESGLSSKKNVGEIQINESLNESMPFVENEGRRESVENSMQGSVGSRSIEYGEFHRVAAELLGEETEYKKSFDIHTSYKALKKAVDRAGEDV